jgi:alpha-galactosidase
MKSRTVSSIALVCIGLGAGAMCATCAAADLTGNWLSAEPRGDGTSRRSYFNLKQQAGKITGTVRLTSSFYSIVDGSGGPEGFTIVIKAGDSERRRTFEGAVSAASGGSPSAGGTISSDELHIAEKRAAGPGPQMIGHRVPDGEGALPARIAPPALHKVRDNGLARTPPMGWNSWNKFSRRVDDSIVRGIADAMVRNGMRDAGYVYINIDDTWEGERDAKGVLNSNTKFPDMKALADYVHGKGLKIGIYSSPGPNTCEGYEGSYGHEVQDARTWAAWGIDYVKYDWCGASNIYTDAEMQAVYQKMGDALLAVRHPIVYSLCQYGRADVWKWGPDVGGNLWRTTGDISDRWASMSRIGFDQGKLAEFARPGHWNDPDMLEIGNGGMSDTEYRTHMSLWSMLAAPLIAGNDLRDVPAPILEILTNREVIAIDQDKAGKQGKRVSKAGDQEFWVRELAGGDHAVAMFNLAADPATVMVNWADLGLKKAPSRVRDLWNHTDVHIDVHSGEYSATIPGHGVVMLRIHN